MFFYFNGCSHTDGVRLEHEEDERFSTLVSNHYNADHRNDAVEGSSNDAIVRRTFEFLEHTKCDYAIIMMTHTDRMELITPTTNTPYKFLPSEPSCRQFYEKYYNDDIGSKNFYKNRFLLEQEFNKRNIPLILLQFDNNHASYDNIWRRRCNGGELPTVTRRLLEKHESILGMYKKHEYFYHEHIKKIDGHFNAKGHRKVADFIINQIDTH